MNPKCNMCIYKTAQNLCGIVFTKHKNAEDIFYKYCKEKWFFPKKKEDKKTFYESLDVIDP